MLGGPKKPPSTGVVLMTEKSPSRPRNKPLRNVAKRSSAFHLCKGSREEKLSPKPSGHREIMTKHSAWYANPLEKRQRVCTSGCATPQGRVGREAMASARGIL